MVLYLSPAPNGVAEDDWDDFTGERAQAPTSKEKYVAQMGVTCGETSQLLYPNRGGSGCVRDDEIFTRLVWIKSV